MSIYRIETSFAPLLFLVLFFFSGCAIIPSESGKGYLNYYPKTSDDAKIILNLHSNIQRTTFYVDGEKMVTGKRVKILVDHKPHTVIASPKGYRSKEEYIQPPYMPDSLLSFTFLLEDKLPSNNLHSQTTTSDIAFSNELPAKFPIKQTNLQGQYAVVIGISTYLYADGTTLSNLAFADKDAQDFANMLYKLGWSKSHVKLLINEQSALRNIKIALDSWLTKAGPSDLIVLYWSGHGFPDPEDPTKVYFACYDTNISIPATGYRMDDVRRSLEEKNVGNVLVLADTCHAGKLITRGNKGISIVPHLEKMRKEKTIPKGWIFMVGAESDRQAIEDTSWSNGAFTRSLLNGISGKADGYMSTDVRDGIVTMGELRAYLNDAMPDETQKVLGVAKRAVIATSSGDPNIWNLSLQMK